MDLPHAFAAVLHDDKILMVQYQDGSRTYWTLPGGEMVWGESLEQTARREIKDVSGLDVIVGQLLFTRDNEYGKSYCFLATLMGEVTEPTLDLLPEEASTLGSRVIAVAWQSLKDKKDDIQVSKVISILGLTHD